MNDVTPSKRKWSVEWAGTFGERAVKNIREGREEWAVFNAKLAATHAFAGHPELVPEDEQEARWQESDES